MLKTIKRSGAVLVTLASLFFGVQASAGIHIEPFFGYAFNGKSSDDTTDDTYTGSLYGARAGYSFLGLLAALEYEMGSLSFKDGEPMNVTNMGLTVGYTFPILIRAYATYQFSAQGKYSATVPVLGEVDVTAKGTGTKLGVGYTGLPFVALNFEMSNLKFNKADMDGTEADIDSTATHYALNLSLPFNF